MDTCIKCHWFVMDDAPPHYGLCAALIYRDNDNCVSYARTTANFPRCSRYREDTVEFKKRRALIEKNNQDSRDK